MEEKKQPSNQQTFKQYFIFWIGQLFSLLGSSIVYFALIWWLTTESGSATTLSIAFFFTTIPQIVITLFAGVYIDRLDRKKIIIFADFFQALTTLILILMFVFNLADIWVVITLMVVRNFFQAIHRPAVAAIIPVMIPKEKLSRMNALNMIVTGAIFTIGPIISGFLIGFWSIETMLWIDIITFILAIIPTIIISIPSIKKAQKAETDEKSSFKKEFKEGYNAIMQIKGMFAFFILCVILNFLSRPRNVLRTYFISIFHKGDVKTLSYISAIMQIGMICGGLLVSLKKQWKKKSIMIIGVFYLVGLAYLIIALAPIGNFLIITIGYFIFALGIPIVNSLYLTILQEVIPLEMQGRVNSIDIALSFSIIPIASLISGPIAEWIGIDYLYIILASLHLIILTLFVIFSDLRYVDKGILK